MILIILVLHLLLGVVIVAAGESLGRRGFAVAALAPLTTLGWLAARTSEILAGRPTTQRVEWVPQLALTLDFRLDGLGVVMVVLVSGIGLLVCVYALCYFSTPSSGVGRLAGLMTLFAGAMLGVVLTDHLLAMFVFWELTSVTSYLLIGNSDRNAEARRAALAAVIITGAGGLAMLAGLVLIGQASGTYRMSELVGALPGSVGSAGAGDLPTEVAVGLVLVLIGVFTKSAQLPFASWLPGAMVASTPISAYLHAATMVKAGVYLSGRLAPAVAELGPWRPLLLVVASITMLAGGWRALRQHDLKLLLAWGTVSQLGFLMLLLGAGEASLAQAGIVLLIAHGAFKAALFMVVGIVDRQTGTRDVRRLDRPGPGWKPAVVTAIVAAASMAGLPPLLGFIAKEKAIAGGLDAGFAGAGPLVGVIGFGSVLTVAYSGRFVLGVLGRLAEVGPDVDQSEVGAGAPPPPAWFVAPAALLAGLSLVAGVAPVLIDDAARAATVSLYAEATPKAVELWTGFNLPLGLSGLIIGLGAVLVALHRPVEQLQGRAHRVLASVPDADQCFDALVDGLSTVAVRVTKVVQSGSLPIYLMVILAVAAGAPLVPALRLLDQWPDLIGPWTNLPFSVLVIAAALGAATIHRRIAAALLLGAVGIVMAGFYVERGAPDLALTQFAIETLATVLFVLVLRFLPRSFTDTRAAVIAPVRVAVSVLVGVSVFVLALAATGARDEVVAPPASAQMVERSVPEGKGANVVNVILVDFRGLDTLGEITVLVVTALGMVALARTALRSGTGLSTLARLPLVDTSVQLLYTSILVLSVYFLFAGHNQPGGGFVGGLTAAAAISLRYVAGGVTSVRRALPVRPWTVLGVGLFTSAATAVVPLLTGNSVLEHDDFEKSLPILGTLKATSALPFDIGVYLVVVGVVLMAYEAFGDDVIAQDDDTADPEDTRGLEQTDPPAGVGAAQDEPSPLAGAGS